MRTHIIVVLTPEPWQVILRAQCVGQCEPMASCMHERNWTAHKEEAARRNMTKRDGGTAPTEASSSDAPSPLALSLWKWKVREQVRGAHRCRLLK